MDNSDWKLLDDYARRNSEAAFRTLVERYAGLVYHAALRQVGNPHRAEEIAQAVFIALARKAGRIPADTILSGWLIRATRFAVLNFIREETRRQRHEQESLAMQDRPATPEVESVWTQIAPHLDDALNRLSRLDRDAVTVRFLENKSHKEVAHILGVSEEAAKKRVARAVEKLREAFARRGVVAPTMVLMAAFSAHGALAAPAGIVSSVAAAALANSAAATPASLTLAKGILKFMAWTKLKTALVATGVVLLTAGTVTFTVKEIARHRTYPWQVEGFDEHVIDAAPPQVRIVPSKFDRQPRSGNTTLIFDLGRQGEVLNDRQSRTMGIYSTSREIMSIVGGGDARVRPTRSIWPAEMPPGRFDFIANLPAGSLASLGETAKKTFGLSATFQRMERDILILKVSRPNAPGLQPSSRPDRRTGITSARSGMDYWQNTRVASLAADIEAALQIPVQDRTGLTNRLDIELPVPGKPERDGFLNFAKYLAREPEAARQAMLEHTGLELVPAREPIEIFVVERTRN